MQLNMEQPADSYNYKRFHPQFFDLRKFSAPFPGDKCPDFTATDLQGNPVRLSDFCGKTVVLEMGSLSCPVYVHRIRAMNKLVKEFPQAVFIVLYVREAHPGCRLGPHISPEDKQARARRLQKEENEKRLILVDDLAGSAHELYGCLPNSVFVISPEGLLLFRGDWNSPSQVSRVLSGPQATHAENDHFRPSALSLLTSLRVLTKAGIDSLTDFIFYLPSITLANLRGKWRSAEKRRAVLDKYFKRVNEILVPRVRIVTAAGACLVLMSSYLDRWLYPAEADDLLKIRYYVFAASAVLFILSWLPHLIRHAVWLYDGLVLIVALSFCVMVYMTGGSASRYYEAIDLVILSMLVVNNYYYKHNLFCGLVILSGFITASTLSPAVWDAPNFTTAIFFVIATNFFAILMTRFYGEEHFREFKNSELLTESEHKLQSLYQQADILAKTDELTQISNRRSFFDALESRVAMAKASKAHFYLVIFDVDNFKHINDTYGHSFGDQVLQSVVQTIRQGLRKNTWMGRYGGDEFMLVLDDGPKDKILARLTTLQKSMQAIPFLSGSETIHVSASFGVARFDVSETPEVRRLVDKADRALLAVKSSGRGGIRLA